MLLRRQAWCSMMLEKILNQKRFIVTFKSLSFSSSMNLDKANENCTTEKMPRKYGDDIIDVT